MTGVLINHAVPSSEILTISTPIRGVNYLAIGRAARLVRGALPRGERGAAGPRPARPRHRAAEHPRLRACDRPQARGARAVRAARRRLRRGQPRRGSRPGAAAARGHARRRARADTDLARVGAEELAVLTACDEPRAGRTARRPARADALRERRSRHVRLVGVPTRGRERPDPVPRCRRAPLRAAGPARAARARSARSRRLTATLSFRAVVSRGRHAVASSHPRGGRCPGLDSSPPSGDPRGWAQSCGARGSASRSHRR